MGAMNYFLIVFLCLIVCYITLCHQILCPYLFIPIVKSNKKAVNDSNNYRAIALSSVIGKILDHIILMKNVNTLCSDDLQFGFKPAHSTSQCIFVLQEIIDLYLRNDSAVYLILLDASKAFDRVKYCTLFDILWNRNMCSSY